MKIYFFSKPDPTLLEGYRWLRTSSSPTLVCLCANRLKFCWLGFLGFHVFAPVPGPEELRSSIFDRGTLTLTLTLRVNPHQILETLANKMLAGWHTIVPR